MVRNSISLRVICHAAALILFATAAGAYGVEMPVDGDRVFFFRGFFPAPGGSDPFAELRMGTECAEWNAWKDATTLLPDPLRWSEINLSAVGDEKTGGKKTKRISFWTAAALDVVFPGGGHFYTDRYGTGYVFLGLKAAAIGSVIYCYRDWKYRRSLYRSARYANGRIDPDHELQFENPGGGYKTVSDYRHDYDRAAQRITFSAIVTVAVYIASLTVLYFNVSESNERSLPVLEMQYGRSAVGDGHDEAIMLQYTGRF